MAKRDTYCEVNFLKKFSEKYVQCSPFDEEQLKKNKCWIGITSFLRSKANIWIDDNAAFNTMAQDNQFCCKIKKQWAGGYLTIKEKKIDLDDIPEEALCTSVFLYDNKDFVTQKAEKLGILLITPSTYDQFAYLFKDNGKSFYQDQEADWSIIKQECKHNFNTIVISDLYLLKEKKINLYALLDVILPSKLETELHISIFTDETPTFQQDQQELVEYIHSIRKNLKFNLSLHKGTNADFHDRGIITNYARMTCGVGFDLFKIKKPNNIQVAKHTTTVLMDYPYFKDSEVTEKNYEDILLDAQRMYNNNICIGTKNNRLLK